MLCLGDSLLILAHRCQRFAVPGVSHRVVWIISEGAAELGAGLRCIPVVIKMYESQSGVCFGNPVVHLQRLLGGFLSGGESLLGREHGIQTQCGVGICDTYVSLRKCWVERYRLPEVFQTLLQPFVGSLIPEIAPLDVGLICLRLLRRALGETAALIARQFQADRLGKTLGKSIFQRKNVGELLVEGFTPELGPVADADELNSQTNPVRFSLNASVEDHVYSLLQTSRLRTHIRPRIFLNGAGRPDDDLSRVSQPGNQGISHSQTQIFLTRLCAHRLEGQNGKRTNLLRFLDLNSSNLAARINPDEDQRCAQDQPGQRNFPVKSSLAGGDCRIRRNCWRLLPGRAIVRSRPNIFHWYSWKSRSAFRLTDLPDLGYKTIPPFGNGLDVFVQVAVVVQGFPEKRNRDGKIPFLDERAVPDSLQ